MTNLIEFKNHLTASANEMLDELAEKDYQEKFNIKIECNGKTLELELNSELYQNLQELLQIEIDNF